MAEPSMFNLYDVATAENQNARTNAMNVAQLPAGRATVYGAGLAGSMLSGGINQMLGRVTPQQQKAEIVNGIMKKYINADPADPQNILMMSRDFANNDLPGLANQFMTQYQTAIKTPEASKPDTYQDNLGATRYLTTSTTHKAGDLVPGETAIAPESITKPDKIKLFERYQLDGGKDDLKTFLQSLTSKGVTVNTGDNETITPSGMKLIEDSTTESGYRFVPIEGGKAWKELEDEKQAAIKAETREEMALATDSQMTYVMEAEIDSALNFLENDFVVGKAAEFYMGMPDWVKSGSPAVGFRLNLEGIKGIIGFDRLQRMRDESETGGALGQVAVLELLALQGTLGLLSPLDPKEKTIEKLKRIKAVYVKNMNDIRKNFSEEELIKFGFSDADIGGTTNKSQEQLIKDELAKRKE